MSINGILIIDKPQGWTSHDVCAKLRGTLKQKRDTPHKQRIGHGGTLDPMATGVLPVFIGKATKAAQFAENAEKEYIAGLRFGIVTDTQDITGNILYETRNSVTAAGLNAVLPHYSGQQKQTPPMYSAVKQGGKKLYELARRGIETERPARDIVISLIELTNNPADGADSGTDFYLRIVCSKGTYIRTLCHDIGQELGCGATLTYLRRTRAGIFSIESAHSLKDIISSQLPDLLLPADSIFSQYPLITLSIDDAKKVKCGMLRYINISAQDGQYRVYSSGGEFLLFGEVKNNGLKMIKSFFEV